MNKLKYNSLIVSCQALEDEPLFGPQIMARMALAAQIGGASAIRANSPQDIKAIKRLVDLPLIGLWKRKLEHYQVYITPTFADSRAVLQAGADYVALDCTARKRPEPLAEIFEKIRDAFPDRGIIADIATLNDAKKVFALRPDYISTTLSGYTEESRTRPKPDLTLIKEIKDLTNIPILAEGNYNDGVQGANALKQGAYAVVIGGAITRPQVITRRIYQEMANNLSVGK